MSSTFRTLSKFLSQSYIDELPHNVRESLAKALEGMQKYREDYKKEIRSFYKQKAEEGKLFVPEGCNPSDAPLARQRNLAELYKLAAHCLVVGDLELIEELVINPLKQGKSIIPAVSVLAYCAAIEKRVNAPSHIVDERVKPYLRDIIVAMTKASQVSQ